MDLRLDPGSVNWQARWRRRAAKLPELLIQLGEPPLAETDLLTQARGRGVPLDDELD